MPTTSSRNPIKCSKGFSLIEIIIVIAVISILLTVVTTKLTGATEKMNAKVCNDNSLQVQELYEAYMILEDAEHSSMFFDAFLQEYDGEVVCPSGGQFMYINEMVQCNVHPRNDFDEEDGESEGVPVL
ncbi:prepilin-type N-terminal cleavage/methylation domain-containing protein [Heliorestis acidaminivorans]|uniref:Prepilin-type N-terminal cleavage/methylation domain-containing protein n=1 Tax=Heliorestis acidaminivorans TaxID=553427 RepID=A0A6I0F2X0_9FIRM|nr:prepilin-type N-terminal cleavage/methylation domain-containing protein [Heliorestis acidaminivorans]KAB2953773.1 prepilin-type N-terminal cleavage/methylation domain-containing protein [Heliorestis acidaminivorans]